MLYGVWFGMLPDAKGVQCTCAGRTPPSVLLTPASACGSNCPWRPPVPKPTPHRIKTLPRPGLAGVAHEAGKPVLCF